MSVYGNKINSEIENIIMKPIVIFLFSLIFLSSITSAAPFLHNPLPANNSFFSGGEINFTINITEADLNASSVTLHLISLDAYQQDENWENYIMDCTNYATSNWNCSKSLSFSAVGSDTLELFYFDAKDNSGNVGMNNTDNATTSLRFTLDRKPPYINFLNPTNGTWVSGVEIIDIYAVDTSSGLSLSSVNYSFDNIEWFNTTRRIYKIIGDSVLHAYNATWNTSSLTNNQTIIIFAKATDYVNNTNQTNVNVTVDNEIPSLEILSPLQNKILNSTVQFRINVSDIYSGIKNDTALFSIAGISESMDCSGSINYTCTKLFDTFRVSDGGYTMSFSIFDIAGNINTTSISVTVTNKKALITISEPVNNSYVNNMTLFRASLSDPTNVDHVKLVTSSEEKNMSCTTDFSGCTVELDTTKYQDGTHNLTAKVVSTSGGILANASIVLIFDNTNPQLTVTYPESPVNGTFTITATITDEFPNKGSVVFQVDTFSETMSCVNESLNKLVCDTIFDSKLLENGIRDMKVSTTDLAGNIISESKKIEVANDVLISDVNETDTNTIQTISNFSQLFTKPQILIPLGLVVLAIVAVILIRKMRKEPVQEKPWYETIGTETGEE